MNGAPEPHRHTFIEVPDYTSIEVGMPAVIEAFGTSWTRSPVDASTKLALHRSLDDRAHMSLVISVCSLKGGVGKSTVTLSLAGALHKAGRKVLVIDSDPQGSLRSWSDLAAARGHDSPPVVSVSAKSLVRELSKLSGGFEVILVDTAPRIDGDVRGAMMAADYVLVPIVAGALDLWALKATLDVLEEARGLRPDLQCGIVLNRVDRTSLATHARKAIDKCGVPIVGTLGARVDFGEATLAGQSVATYATGSKASIEVRQLMKAVIESMKAVAA